MIGRIGAGLLATAVALLSDGASLETHTPAPPVSSHPPVSSKGLPGSSPSKVGPPRTRAVLGATARLFVDHPNDSALAASLLELARNAGREDWLRDVVRASIRRLPTAATLFLSAELESARGGHAAALKTIRRAYRATPQDVEIAVSYAAALAGTGRPVAAFAVLPRLVGDGESPAVYSERALQRVSVIAGAVAPDGLGDLLTTSWLRRSWQWDNRSARTRAMAFASALAIGVGRDGASLALARASLVHAERSADAEASVIALMNAAEITGDARLVRRFEGACEVIPLVSDVARTDCLVSAVQHAVFAGEFARAFELYSRLEARPASNPLLVARLGAVAITLLQLNGEFGQSVRMAAAAAAAASAMGNRDLEGNFLARLAQARRLAGDFPGAREAAVRATAVSGSKGPAADRAIVERMAAERAARGEPALIELGDTDSGAASAPVQVPLQPASSVSSSSGTDLRDPGFSVMLQEIRQGLALEREQRPEAALVIYLRAIDYVQSHQARKAGDLLEAATLSDIWQGLTRRALDLALSSGRVELGLEILETSRRWARYEEGDRELGVNLDLPSDTALVAYAVGRARTWAIVLRRGEAVLSEIPLEPAALRDLVGLWRELAKSNGGGETWRLLGERLYRALLMPVEAPGLLDGVHHVRFVPDDVLHLVPFATLATVRGEGAVSYAVSQFPSVDSALQVPARPHPDAPLVAFGAGGGSGSVEEMLSVRRLGGRIFAGSRATETEWKRQSVTASAMHFGGHAAPVGQAKWAAALHLTADSANDGLLTIAEILAVPLRGAIVVLLGCDTAARPEEPGPAAFYRQVPSLGEAFLAAGAGAVVGNLWAITEEDARLIAEEFYGAGGPARGAAALEQARAALRRRFPDMPRRWAGAVWLGAATPPPSVPEFPGR